LSARNRPACTPTAGLAGLLALLSLGALGLAGCPRLPAFLGGKDGTLDELRSCLAPLVAEAGKLCRLTPEPSACATAAKELEASLDDAEQLLRVVGACRGDDARVCLMDAQAAAAALVPRVAERVKSRK
jgi:hypothetical protein